MNDKAILYQIKCEISVLISCNDLLILVANLIDHYH